MYTRVVRTVVYTRVVYSLVYLWVYLEWCIAQYMPPWGVWEVCIAQYMPPWWVWEGYPTLYMYPTYTPWIYTVHTPVLHQRVYTVGYARVCSNEALGSNLGILTNMRRREASQLPKV